MLIRPQAAPLRFIATRLSVPELERVVRQPGVAEALRVTVQYHDGRHPDQIATYVKSQPTGAIHATVHYRRASEKPLILEYNIDAARFKAVNTALRKLGFDKLDDYADIPWHGADLWLIERAAVNFHHDVIIAPDSATGPHAEIVTLVRDQLHEALRGVNP
jgi:hypothetical protein